MITMEFDEMKKIWDSQNNEPLYGFSEKALHNRVLAKKRQAYHITNVSELLCIAANFVAGGSVVAIMRLKPNPNFFLYPLAIWMLGSALYLLWNRIRRIKSDNHFGRSLREDLDHAVALTTYQVRLSTLMRWNTLPIGMFVILGVWQGGKSVWMATGILIFFALAHYAAGWEHKIYKSRKRELEKLKNKLENEE